MQACDKLDRGCVPPEQKTRRKKRLPMAPKEIVPIRNPDKIGAEHWTPERAHDIGNFPAPARIVLLGPCGVGKSTLIKNLIMHQRPRFKEVILIHEDAGTTKEYIDLECTAELADVPPLDYWLQNEGHHVKRAVIVDDLELTSAHKERRKNLAILFRYVSTHRSMTIYFGHQSTFDVPPLIRKMANVWIIWKPRARTELTTVEDRTGMPPGSLHNLFDTVATGHRDSITIDLSEGSPAPLRLNVFQPLELVPEESPTRLPPAHSRDPTAHRPPTAADPQHTDISASRQLQDE